MPTPGQKSSNTPDLIADAILRWWEETQGPHKDPTKDLPVYFGIRKAMKLAEFLRAEGFIKDGK